MQQNNKIFTPQLFVIFGITLMAVLGLSSTTPAFPKISQLFGVEKQNVGLLLTFFTIPGVIFTPILGIMADRYGRKKVLFPSMILFSLAGFACGFATSFEMLLAFTFLQGIGAASLGALNVTLIGDMYPNENRTSVMGYNNSILAIGTASFPLIGGALAAISWNYPFFMPIVGLIVAFFINRTLTEPDIKRQSSLKLYFQVFLQSIKNPQLIALFVVSLSTFIILFGLFLSYLPFIVSDKFGGEPFLIGIFLMSMSATTALTSIFLGKFVKNIGQYKLLLISAILYATAILLMYYIPKLWMLPISTILYGIAHGLNVPNVQSIIAGLAPTENRGAFMSINRMVSQLGQALGPILMSFVFGLFALKGVFWISSALALSLFFVILFYVKKAE